MAAADQIAGHPIAIRVGGRRMSQSNTKGSPTKQQISSASSSPEDGGTGVAEVPDYPRPRSPAKQSAEPDGEPANEHQNNQGGGQNRQERRRQERRREKSNRDDQQQGTGSALSQQNDAMFNHLRKGGERTPHSASQKGANGVRITQPAQKFMA